MTPEIAAAYVWDCIIVPAAKMFMVSPWAVVVGWFIVIGSTVSCITMYLLLKPLWDDLRGVE